MFPMITATTGPSHLKHSLGENFLAISFHRWKELSFADGPAVLRILLLIIDESLLSLPSETLVSIPRCPILSVLTLVQLTLAKISPMSHVLISVMSLNDEV